MVSARTSARSISDKPFVGSSNKPREAGVREMAAGQIFHDGGPANLGTRSRANIMVVAGSGNAPFAVAGEEHFDMPKLFILGKVFGAAFFEFVSDLRGIPLHSEIEIAQRSAGNEVANGSAGQVDVEP